MLRRVVMVGALLAWLAPVTSAQTVGELVAKYIQAHGGMKKIKTIHSLKVTGKMVMDGGAMEAPLVQMKRRPQDSRTEITFQGMTSVQAFDGKSGTAWSIMPLLGKNEPEASPAEEIQRMAEEADFDGALVDWQEKGHRLERMGKEPVEGADAWKLKLTRKSGKVDYVYLDVETGLQVKIGSKRTVRGTEIEGETLMSDYKEVEGIPFPFTITASEKGAPAEQRRKIVIEKIELNVPLADSLFAMPPTAAQPDSLKAAAKPHSTKAAAKRAARAGRKK